MFLDVLESPLIFSIVCRQDYASREENKKEWLIIILLICLKDVVNTYVTFFSSIEAFI